jgi:hypothetical protein
MSKSTHELMFLLLHFLALFGVFCGAAEVIGLPNYAYVCGGVLCGSIAAMIWGPK